jgi:hypothetical protein
VDKLGVTIGEDQAGVRCRREEQLGVAIGRSETD